MTVRFSSLSIAVVFLCSTRSAAAQTSPAPVWFHALFHEDGQPYRQAEADFIRRRTSESNGSPQPAGAQQQELFECAYDFPMRNLRIVLSALLLLGGGAASLPACAAAKPGSGTVQHQYQGTLGSSSIGMTILRADNTIEGGHYFYQKYLQDIPLTGTEQDSTVTLREPGGGTFHLHFTGNGSNGAAPLDFENSIGMEGTWTRPDGLHTEPVSLRGTAIEYGNPDDRYASITSAPAAVFEKRVQSLVRAVLAGDRTTAVRFISYPLSVNLANGERKRCRTSAQVLAAWDDIFTAALLEDLRKDLPHDMFVHDGAAMLGNGEAWFDAKGLSTVNVPASANHKPQ